MTQDSRLRARQHSKAYYERLKADEAKLAARNAKVAERMRAYRAKKRRPSEITPTEITPSEITGPSKITLPVEEGRPCVGGKHSPAKTQGEVQPSMESIIAEWQRNFDQQELAEERAAIREFGGG